MIVNRPAVAVVPVLLVLGVACSQMGGRGRGGGPEERAEMMRRRAQADTTQLQVPQRPPARTLAEASARARAGHRRVLVVWLPADSLEAAALTDTLQSDRMVSGKIAWEYEPLWADPEMTDSDQALRALRTSERDSLNGRRPAFAVLDPEGAVLGRLAAEDSGMGGMMRADRLDRRALFSFLLRNQAPYPDAVEILEAAEDEARKSDRLYFLLFTEGGCEPCDLFLLWLERPAVKAIWDSTFVNVVIDLTRSINGGEIYMQNVGQRSRMAGLPLFAVKRANGRKLGDSFVMPEGGNVGFPWTDEEVEAFRGFLEKRVERITPGDRTILISELRAFRAEIEALTKAAGQPAAPPPSPPPPGPPPQAPTG